MNIVCNVTLQSGKNGMTVRGTHYLYHLQVPLSSKHRHHGC